MLPSLFARKPVNNGRQRVIDLVKVFIEKRRALCYGLVIAASVVVCAWACGAGPPLPNFMNNYLN